jgi:tRNA G18 (ribose-2'-O)-methylase SpoU
VVFQRIDEPVWALKAKAMKRHSVKQIESEQNEIFKGLKKLLTARGVKKQNRALLSGQKQVLEILRDYPQQAEAWISSGEANPPPLDAPEQLAWYHLAPKLFDALDMFGTHYPLLLLRVEPLPGWDPAAGLPTGCSVLVPFQDPENVGAVIRSAAAFGASQAILLEEAAHPYHPKALRASGGAVLRIKLLQGPALEDLTDDLPLVPLSVTGQDIVDFIFPDAFGLLPGLEGPGVPDRLKPRAVSIPIASAVESLNASVAAAIALYAWARSKPK